MDSNFHKRKFLTDLKSLLYPKIPILKKKPTRRIALSKPTRTKKIRS